MLKLIGRLRDFYQAVFRSERHQALIAKIAITEHIARLQADYRDSLRLEGFGFKVYSQCDEDGIIQEIFRRIGTDNRRFIEIGCGDGSENCTVYLLHQGWSGLWIDNVKNENEVSRRWSEKTASGKLTFVSTFIRPDNVNSVLRDASMAGDVDLLVIDIDGNDYHVLKNIDAIRPRVICVEYNASFPPPYNWVMPHDDNHAWDGSNHFGASLSAYEELLREKGFSLVGCCLSGANAFFVRSNLVEEKFSKPLTAEHLYQPPRYYLSYLHPYVGFGFLIGHPPR